uniref:Gem (nuclear organelle) associated protein 2 n=1 Tax=Erpetoichthys calabaricus TaxID=27687 RepID=A0A8C4XI62_ERPCA
NTSDQFKGQDLIPRCLPVEDYDLEDFDPSTPPRNPQEYLRQVQLEAAKCPDFVVKRQTMKVLLSICQPAPDGYSPSLKWQQIQVANFSAVRQSVVKHRAHWQAHTLDQNVMMPKVEDDEDVKNEEMGCSSRGVCPPLEPSGTTPNTR